MSTRHREQFADVGNGGELRFGEHRPKIVDALAIGICLEQGIDPVDRADGSYNWWMFRSTAEEFLKRSLLEQVAPK